MKVFHSHTMREKRWKRFLNAMTCFPTATTHRIHTVFRMVSGKRVRYQDGLRKHDSTSSHLSFQPARYQAKHVLKDCPCGASFRTHQGRREGALIEFQFEGESFFLLDIAGFGERCGRSHRIRSRCAKKVKCHTLVPVTARFVLCFCTNRSRNCGFRIVFL